MSRNLPYSCCITHYLLLFIISSVGCGSMLLESNTRLLKCCIDSRNQLFLQHVQINMLVNFYPSSMKMRGVFYLLRLHLPKPI